MLSFVPRYQSTLVLIFLLILLAHCVSAQQRTVKVMRVEISSPWSGFYYESQGSQVWAKAVVNNPTSESLRGATLRFEFVDPVGPRETFEMPLPVVNPGGVVTVESPHWWDYSGAAVECKVTVLKDGKSIATGQTENHQ